MPRLTMQETVNAPPARTFAAFSDLRNAAENISAIKRLEILTDGPVGQGTRFKEARMMFGREATETMAITQWSPDAPTPAYAIGGDTCGARFESVFRFHPADGGRSTRVEFEMSMQAVTLFAKIMMPLSKLLMGPMMRKCLLADVRDMKRVAEAPQ